MLSADNDIVIVEQQTIQSMTEEYDASDSDSIISDDSAIFVLSNPPTLSMAHETAKKSDGHALEQREDIIKTKEIPLLLQQLLTFKDEATLINAIDRVGAREHLDKDIENEINNVQIIANNEKLIDENLKKAARIALENILVARKTASDGQTTVKRAMEVIVNALPVFKEACEKSYEDNRLSEEVMSQLRSYEEGQQIDKQAAFDIVARQLKESQALEHLEIGIEKAEKDVKKISDKRNNEITQDRLASFIAVKKDIEGIISDENGEVGEFLDFCKSDLEQISKLQHEQTTRFADAKTSFENRNTSFEANLSTNKKNQEDLQRQLRILQDQENRLMVEQEFQRNVQKRAKELHEQVFLQLANLESSISDIHGRAVTAEKVMDSMTICGRELLDASIAAEEQYTSQLKSLEIEAKTRLRFALATNAVEQRIKIDNASENIEDYKEQMKSIQQSLKKAVQKRQTLTAKKEEESLKEFTREKKKEQDLKKESETYLENIMEKLKICDEDLNALDVPVDSVDELYAIRREEMESAIEPVGDGYSSLELTDTEDE